jgi:hypothetical protein
MGFLLEESGWIKGRENLASLMGRATRKDRDE